VERDEGSGIGLFLARTALRAQGGDVRLRNDSAGGLVATIYLPPTPR
jgi:signal transduction histidine kinase